MPDIVCIVINCSVRTEFACITCVKPHFLGNIFSVTKITDTLEFNFNVAFKITKEIVIAEQKPRSKEFQLSEQFLAYKKEILAHLQGKSIDESVDL